MNTSIRCVVLGLGHIGSRHARLVAAHPQLELVAGVDPDGAARERARKETNFPVFENFNALEASGLPFDLACVCTPNGLHVEHCLRALRRGAHVVCEKPFGLSPDRCRQVVMEAKDRNLKLFCVLQNRYSPPARLLKKLIEEGRLGRLLQMQVSCVWNRDERYYRPGSWRGSLALDGGPLFTQFSHFLDLMVWLAGPMRCAEARFANFAHRHNTEFEDTGEVWLDGLDGLRASVQYTTAAWDRNFESRIVLHGKRGVVCAGGQYMERIEYAHIDGYALPELEATAAPNDYGGWQGSADNHARVFENVAETLLRGGQPDADGPDALRTVALIDEIYRKRPAFPKQAG